MSRRHAEVFKVDYQAAADRLKIIFEALTANTVGGNTVSVDYGAFHRAIDYCRHRAAKANENTDFMPEEEEELCELLYKHNQCTGWVFGGDPSGMILELALNTSSVRRPQLRVV